MRVFHDPVTKQSYSIHFDVSGGGRRLSTIVRNSDGAFIKGWGTPGQKRVRLIGGGFQTRQIIIDRGVYDRVQDFVRE